MLPGERGHAARVSGFRVATDDYVRKRQPLVQRLQHTSAYVSIRQHTSAYVSIRYVSICQHTSAYVSIRQMTTCEKGSRMCSACSGSISSFSKAAVKQQYLQRLHQFVRTSVAAAAYVSIRQHTSAYVSIRQHTSAYVSSGSNRSSALVQYRL